MDSTLRIDIKDVSSIFLNQSRWKDYQDCDRLYAWKFVEGLTPIRPAKAPSIGTAIHKAQVLIHQEGRSDDAIARGVELGVKTFEKIMTPVQGPAPYDLQETIDDGKDVIRRLIPAYYRTYRDGQLWKPLGQELSFCVEVGEGTNVYLVGTIDNLVSFMNALWLVDYKTMHKMDMREFLKYEIDIQLTAYIYGGTKQLSLDAKREGKPPVMIRGAIIDGMVKTQVPQFHRAMYTRTIDDLREFEQEFCFKAWEIAAKHAMVRRDRASYDYFVERMYSLGSSTWKTAFPKNTNNCFRFGTCAFRDLCTMDNETRRAGYAKRGVDYVDEARRLRR